MPHNWSALQGPDVLEHSRAYLFRPEFLGSLAQYLGLDSAATVLDVGTGSGFFARLLAGMVPAERDVRAVGLDSDPALIDAASKLAAQAGLEGRVRFVGGDAYRLPFPDGGFDLVVSHTLLGVLSQPLRAIREQVRVTRAGGTVAALESVPGLPAEVNSVPYPGWPELDALLQRQGKVHLDRVLPGYVRRPLPSYRFPLLFRRAGLEGITVSGYLCTFSPSDARLAAGAGHAWLVAGAEIELAQVQADFAAHARNYDAGGFSSTDRGRVLELLADRLKWIRSHPTTALRAWPTELRPRLVVTGRKPSAATVHHYPRADSTGEPREPGEIAG